ncbi:carbohydrate ABC transporter permease [Planomonospora venezuelensis]|uniref:N,N'-diacetylchitobiose transport system permease protein n=1 Tax=Planomonospora venezuelensis TaxID=1999 RepID=A0A841CVJ2_PLAVE|nr:sugar ABC transporter permease [Planomonospora venezuelensis]MBB5962412.1 N,N'-diacetylchitobiose transport system permease protein [Planomonospora venezuelensis]GIN00794.1 sugar transporter [Planomonospora venezuelensis]
MTTLATTPAGPQARARRAGPRPRRRDGLRPWLYLLPAAAVLLPLLGYPIYMLGLLSVFDYRQAQVSGGEPTTFVGFGNYATLLGDQRFWSVLGQTVAFAAALVVATLAVGATLAVVLSRAGRVPRLLLSLAAMAAWAAPAMTGSTVWMFLFDADLGLVNQVLGIEGFNWFYDRWVAFGVVGATVVWHSFPFVMVTLYAGIQAVPASVIEAAALDGASAWQSFWKVLVPILRPLITIVVIQSIIWDFKIFTQIYVMTNGGGIAGQNSVLNVYAYQTAFGSSEYGLGSAIGMVMTLILLAVTLLYIRALHRRGESL